MLLDFGFSADKYQDKIEWYARSHQSAANVEEVIERYQFKSVSFNKWFIDNECKTISDILYKIEQEFILGNSVYPSNTPARLLEYLVRRYHINTAISYCYILKQELQYVIRTLPVDLNKYERFDTAINEQIVLLKDYRQRDNRNFNVKESSDNSLFSELTKLTGLLINFCNKVFNNDIN